MINKYHDDTKIKGDLDNTIAVRISVAEKSNMSVNCRSQAVGLEFSRMIWAVTL